jgi:hypothetical protein
METKIRSCGKKWMSKTLLQTEQTEEITEAANATFQFEN